MLLIDSKALPSCLTGHSLAAALSEALGSQQLHVIVLCTALAAVVASSRTACFELRLDRQKQQMQALQNRTAGRCCSSAHRVQALPALPVRRAPQRANNRYHDSSTLSSACRAYAGDSDQPQHMQETAVQAVQEAEQLQSAALLPAPVPRILTRRSVKYEEDLHKHLGLVLFGAYVLGSASSVAGVFCLQQ